MAALILPDNKLVQASALKSTVLPNKRLALNTSYPNVGNIIGFWPFNGVMGTRDLCNSHHGLITGNTISIASSNTGMDLLCAGDNNDHAVELLSSASSTDPLSLYNTDFTIIWRAYYANNFVSTYPRVIEKASSHWGFGGYSIIYFPTTLYPGQYGFAAGTGGPTVLSSVISHNNAWISCAVSQIGSSIYFHVDGYASTSDAVDTITNASARLVAAASSYDKDKIWDGYISYIVILNKGLTYNECKSIWDNPSQMVDVV